MTLTDLINRPYPSHAMKFHNCHFASPYTQEKVCCQCQNLLTNLTYFPKGKSRITCKQVAKRLFLQKYHFLQFVVKCVIFLFQLLTNLAYFLKGTLKITSNQIAKKHFLQYHLLQFIVQSFEISLEMYWLFVTLYA